MGKGRKKGKGGGKKGSKIIDGLSPNEMTPVQLLGHIKRLQTEIEREREERNFFMLEREKLFTLWNLAVEQLSEEKQKARLFDVQMEQNKKETKSDMDLYKQKLRFLQSEQSKKLGLVRLNHLEKIKKIQDDVWAVQLVMKESLLAKKKQLRNSQTSLYELLRRMHMEHAAATAKMRKQYASEIRRVEMSMDRKLVRDREIADSESRQEMSRVLQIKEEQFEYLKVQHDKQVQEMKTFYNDLMVNNFAAVATLQKDVAYKKMEEERLRKDLKDAKGRYLALLGPVKDMESKMKEWDGMVVDVNKVHDELQRVTAQLEKNNHIRRMLECASEALIERMELMKAEDGSVKKELTMEILDMQKKCSMQRLVLQLKIRAVKQETEMFKAMVKAKIKGAAAGDVVSSEENSGRDSGMAVFLRSLDGGPPGAQVGIVEGNLQETCENGSIPFEEIGYSLLVKGSKGQSGSTNESGKKKAPSRKQIRGSMVGKRRIRQPAIEQLQTKTV